jgi:coenzyme F420-reducing hydrogenase beta subunit
MIRDEQGFLYPEVDEKNCSNCGLCEKICPITNPISNEKKIEDIRAYAAINSNEEIRLNSSSGGVFTLIANYVVENGGAVFGVGFDDNFNAVHKMAESINGIEEFRGSKYVQSTIGNTYKLAKESLDQGKMVLFTGTPCQIGGLYAYLRKDYENLITQDLICHGVPSPSVWQKYVEYRSTLALASVRRISSRRKNYGWKRFSVSFSFENDTEYLCPFPRDPFMRLFLDNYCLRPSCYDCSFKGKIRQSDITLADFWGVNNVLPEMDDDKGTSLIFVNSEKGRKIFDAIKSNLNYKPTAIEYAVKYNSAMISSVKPAKKQKQFWVDFNKKSFNKLEKKYCKPVKVSKLRIILSKIKRKILGVKK